MRVLCKFKDFLIKTLYGAYRGMNLFIVLFTFSFFYTYHCYVIMCRLNFTTHKREDDYHIQKLPIQYIKGLLEKINDQIKVAGF